MKIIYIKSNRSHKLLPLLSDHEIDTINNFKDLLKIVREHRKSSMLMIDSFGIKGLVGLIVSLCLSSILVVRMRGDFFEEEKDRKIFFFRYFSELRYLLSVGLTKLILARAEGIILNSNYLFKVMAGRIHGHKTLGVVYNPFTPINDSTGKNKLQFDPDGFLLISATNMSLNSKVMFQLERMLEIPFLMWENLNLYWFVCGDGVLKKEAEKIVTNRGLQNRIIFTGKINNIYEYFKACHVCIHFSMMDAFPNTTLEAMHYGVPVITNDMSCGTLEQVFHNKNGLILKQNDSVLEAVTMYKDNPEMRKSHGKWGHDYVTQKFSVNAQRQKMNNIIRLIHEKSTNKKL